jgi:hypothetical protein
MLSIQSDAAIPGTIAVLNGALKMRRAKQMSERPPTAIRSMVGETRNALGCVAVLAMTVPTSIANVVSS